jgi:hypothetical protein
VYVASGPLALAAARLDQAERDERERREADWRAERERLEALDALVAAWYAAVGQVADGAMAAAGCYRHKRQCRRKRMTEQERAEAEKRLNDYWARARAGDPGLLGYVKRIFDVAPALCAEMSGGGLVDQVVSALTDRVAGPDLVKREAVARELATVQSKLEGPDPSPLEQQCTASGDTDLAVRAAGGLSGPRQQHPLIY